MVGMQEDLLYNLTRDLDHATSVVKNKSGPSLFPGDLLAASDLLRQISGGVIKAKSIDHDPAGMVKVLAVYIFFFFGGRGHGLNRMELFCMLLENLVYLFMSLLSPDIIFTIIIHAAVSHTHLITTIFFSFKFSSFLSTRTPNPSRSLVSSFSSGFPS